MRGALPVLLLALGQVGCGTTVESSVEGQELVVTALAPDLAGFLHEARQSLEAGDVSGATDRYASLFMARQEDPWMAILYQEARFQGSQRLSASESAALYKNLRSSYREAAESAPTPLNLLLAARAETDPYAALHLADRALALNPSFAWGRYARAHALSRLGKMEAAKAEVERAITLQGDLLPAWRLLAWLRSRAGEWDIAIETWNSWLEASSGDPRISEMERVEAICDLGVLLVRAKRHDEAVMLLDEAASDLSGRSSSVLAAAASETGALDEALAATRTARARDPEELLFVVQEALLLERLAPHGDLAHAVWDEVIERTQGATELSALLERTRAEAHLAKIAHSSPAEGAAAD